MEELKKNLKSQIVEHLNIEDVDPTDITDSGLLFDELGLDSIDALELIVLLESQYGLKISNPEDGQKIFRSIDSMAAFIKENQT